MYGIGFGLQGICAWDAVPGRFVVEVRFGFQVAGLGNRQKS